MSICKAVRGNQIGSRDIVNSAVRGLLRDDQEVQDVAGDIQRLLRFDVARAEPVRHDAHAGFQLPDQVRSQPYVERVRETKRHFHWPCERGR